LGRLGRDEVTGLLQFQADRLEHGIQVFEDEVVPEPHHPEALRVQPGRPVLVLRGPDGMLAPVQLDDQPALKTNEVRDVRADRGLPTELGFGDLIIAQAIPQATLGVGRLPSELVGKGVDHGN
jgi:hypothetical protein